MSNRKVSHGIDLTGFSKGMTAIARAEKAKGDGVTEIRIIDEECFRTIHEGADKIAEIGWKESECIERYLLEGPVYINAPIDLQGLPNPVNPHFVWQLTMRPVDRAFNALPPLADRIGYIVGRFRFCMRTLKPGFLGVSFFETYPAASLGLMNLINKTYKGNAVFKETKWQGLTIDKRDRNLAKLLNELGWTASSEMELDSDEFDAALCAVTGVMPDGALLKGDGLKKHINDVLEKKFGAGHDFDAPEGYVLLKKLPGAAIISRD